MHIHSRPVVIFQLIFLCLLSPYYLHLAESLVNGVSSLDVVIFKNFILNRPLIMLLMVSSVVAAWRMSKLATIMTTVLVICSLSVAMTMALQELNKIILLMSFVYAVTSYYLVMLYRVETGSAPYNPLYSQQTIGRLSEYDLPCFVYSGDHAYQGQLTNWDENGCFISLTPGEGGLADLREDIRIEVRLDGHIFEQIGEVVSTYERGVGIRFTSSAEERDTGYNWLEYFKIIDDRGYMPRSRKA